MPILDIEIVLRPGETLPENLAQELADRLGSALDAPPGSTWVKARGLARDRYAESGGTPEDLFPVFVSILKSSLPSPERMEAEVDAVIGVVSRICARPRENVHVIYLPEGRGRVAFGGKLVR
ncbi:MAG: hypothetical protein AB1750_18430 [Chloroflexota bacterium]